MHFIKSGRVNCKTNANEIIGTVGISRRNPIDRFDLDAGRRRALARALESHHARYGQQPNGRAWRQAFWDVYFQSTKANRKLWAQLSVQRRAA